MNSTGALQKREMSTARFSLCSSQVLRFFTESWGMREIGYRNSCKKSMLSGSILVTTHKRKTIQTCQTHKIPGSTFRVGTSSATPSGLTRRAGAWSCRSPAQGRRPAAFSASSASFLSPNPSTASERHHNADRLSRLWRWRPPFPASDAHSRLCRGTLRLLEGR